MLFSSVENRSATGGAKSLEYLLKGVCKILAQPENFVKNVVHTTADFFHYYYYYYYLSENCFLSILNYTHTHTHIY